MNKHAWIILIVAVALLTACGSYTASESKTSPERTHVKIAYLPVTHGLPLYLALEKGYFAAEGIDVEAVKIDSPNLILNMLVSSQVDFGATSTAAGITAVAEYANPGKLKIFAVGGSSLSADAINEGLIVGKESAITSIADLEGKKVGILPSIQWRTIARHIFAQNGLSVDSDLTLVELAPGLQAQALQVGQVDALLTIEPILTVAEKNGISRALVHAPVEQYVADPMYAGAGVVSLAFAKENPEATEKVLKVFAKAIDEINQNPEATRPYLKGYTPLDDALINEVPAVVFKMSSQMTEDDIAALQKFFDIFTTHGVIAGRVNASELIYKP